MRIKVTYKYGRDTETYITENLKLFLKYIVEKTELCPQIESITVVSNSHFPPYPLSQS